MAVNETTQDIVCPGCGNRIGTARFEMEGTDANAPSHLVECPRCGHQWHMTVPGALMEIEIEPHEGE